MGKEKKMKKNMFLKATVIISLVAFFLTSMMGESDSVVPFVVSILSLTYVSVFMYVNRKLLRKKGILN